MGSKRCDCKEQLDLALDYIQVCLLARLALRAIARRAKLETRGFARRATLARPLTQSHALSLPCITCTHPAASAFAV
eukprot:1411229-Rhodomonas_salina.3